jgi:flagellar protein FliS
MNAVRHLEAYKQNQLSTTDTGSVLLLLYQGAIDSLNRAAMYLGKGDMAEKGKCVLRANDIINQFLASLDYEVGGELAQNLEGLYRYMLDQILLANLNNDPEGFKTVALLLATLKDGWESAVADRRKKVAAKGAA